MSSDTKVMSIAERLTAGIGSKPDIIALARLGPRAQCDTPRLLNILMETDDYHVRKICLDALGAILADSSDEPAGTTTRALIDLFKDQKFKRIRRRIAMTLGRIGRPAFIALPLLASVMRQGSIGSVRVAVRAAFLQITRRCFESGGVAEQLAVLDALSMFRDSYFCWYARMFLAQFDVAPQVRATTEALLKNRAKTETLK